ncbi:MAG: hypothetical protein IJM32_06630 [Ruminococcus sp.]|nr:hypothetical protein [Ruminococcus sp.]
MKNVEEMRFAEFCNHSKELDLSQNEILYWGLRKMYKSLSIDLKSPMSTGDGWDCYEKALQDFGIDHGEQGDKWVYDPDFDYTRLYIRIYHYLEYMYEICCDFGTDRELKDVRDADVRDVGYCAGITREDFKRYPDEKKPERPKYTI